MLACALLAADGRIPADRLRGLVLLGELPLDGRLRPVPGVLPAVLAARRVGIDQVVVPTACLAEAALVDGVQVYGATCLKDVLRWLRDPAAGLIRPDSPRPAATPVIPDLADVLGQGDARWAVEVAAAGGHHLLLTGPPGTGSNATGTHGPLHTGTSPQLSDTQFNDPHMYADVRPINVHTNRSKITISPLTARRPARWRWSLKGCRPDRCR
jgi:magnesium chelatase family protein